MSMTSQQQQQQQQQQQPALAIASGSIVTLWKDYDNHSEFNKGTGSSLQQSSFNPGGGSTNIADVAWNHNAQVLATCSTAGRDHQTNHRTDHNIFLSSMVSSASTTASITTTTAGGGDDGGGSSSPRVLDSFSHNEGWKQQQEDQQQQHLHHHQSSTAYYHHNHHRSSSAAPSSIKTTSAHFGGKSRYLILGDSSGGVCLWDLKKQSRVRQMYQPQEGSILQAQLDPTATFVCSLTRSSCTFHHLRQATLCTRIVSSSSPFTCMATSHSTKTEADHPSICLGQENATLSIYSLDRLLQGAGGNNNNNSNTSTYQFHRQPPPAPHVILTSSSSPTSPIVAAAFGAFHPHIVMAGHASGRLEWWDTRASTTNQQLVHSYTPTLSKPNATATSSSPSVSSIAFSALGHYCALGTSVGEVQVYDIRQMGSDPRLVQQQWVGPPLHSAHNPRQLQRKPITALEFAPLPKHFSVLPTNPMMSTTTSVTSDMASMFSLNTSNDPSSFVAPGLPHADSLQSIHSMTDDHPPPSEKLSSSYNNNSNNNNNNNNFTTIGDMPSSSRLAGSTNSESGAGPGALSLPPKPTNAEFSFSEQSPPLQRPTSTLLSTNTMTSRSNSIIPDVEQTSSNMTWSSQYSGTVPASGTTNTGTSLEATNAPSTTTTTTIPPSSSQANYDAAWMADEAAAAVVSREEMKTMIEQTIQGELLQLREDLEESIRHVHVDMIRQFQQLGRQSFGALQDQQIQQQYPNSTRRMEELQAQNDLLREQNEQLRRQLNLSRSNGSKQHGTIYSRDGSRV